MTDFDDWFRDDPKTGADQQGTAAPGAAVPGAAAPGTAAQGAANAVPGRAEPTVQLPVRSPGQGPAAPLSAPGPGGGLTQPGFSWPEQPAQRTASTPPRPASGFSTGLPDGGSGRGWRRWLRPRRIIAVLAVLLSLALIGSVAGYFYIDSKLTKISALVPSAATAGQNWLITGSTGHLTRRQVVRLHTGYNFDTLSDTILLLHIPANGSQPTLVSIPRDSYVTIPGHGMNKINAAYAFGGAPLLVRTVQNMTGLHIDHYLGIGYAGFVSAVNAVGGVRVCLPGPVVDPKAGLHLTRGCHNLDGKQALGFVRTRQFALGDLQRVQDQRILIKALLHKMTSFGTLINPFAIIPAAVGSASAITVDQGTGLYQLVEAAFALKNPVTTTVPFGGFATNSAGSVVLWNAPQAHMLFHDLATDRAVPKRLITGSKVTPTA